MATDPIPAGYHTITPYLIVERAQAVLEFLTKAFDAQLRFRMDGPDGTIGHAEVQVGDSRVMLAEASDRWPSMPGGFHLYLEDCDAAYERALRAGATSVQEPSDQFYGDRTGGVRDPVGNVWWLATHVEDVSEEEMARRSGERASQQG
jgi:PhnB protein